MAITNGFISRLISVAFLAGLHGSFTWAAITMPSGAALEEMCDHSIACSVIDQDWPKNKTFTCASGTISETAFVTVTEAITIGNPRNIQNGTSWPASASSLEPKLIFNPWLQGEWTVYYTIRATCKCRELTGDPNATPMCRSATSQDRSACNLAVFQFCSVEMDGTTCV
ncbi:hypothetical protein VP01_967g8 [Puccinia sorghi]|uniref:Uncharacterized protein n=1 Tax=Puccinia sorghi TaxID=27349 RepID=A0A0L6U858_9BASI|nr:hypothetical protein VP01_967g8 [Puccinia sorghi]